MIRTVLTVIVFVVLIVFMRFNFFKKETQQVPQQMNDAVLVRAEDRDYFLAAAKSSLEALGATTVTFDGQWVLIDGTSTGKQKLGLTNVSQICLAADKKDWPKILTEHFSNALHSVLVPRDVATSGPDFSKVEKQLRVQLYPTDYLLQIGKEAQDNSIYRVDIPGTISVLMIDEPTTIQTVSKKDAKQWGKTNQELFSIGLNNTLNATSLESTLQTLGNTEVTLLTGDDILSAVNVLTLERQKGCTGIHGVLVGIPNRHTIICFQIDLKSISSISVLGAVIKNMNLNGPGSLSPLIYWYKDGVFEDQPYSIDEANKKFNFAPTDKFINELNSMK